MDKIKMDQLQKDITGWPNQTISVYPLLAAGVALTADAAGWTYGAAIEVLPAVLNTGRKKIVGIQLDTLSAADEYQVQLLADTTAKAAVPFSAESLVGPMPPIMFPEPIFVEAGAAINAKLACNDAVARTCNIKLIYAPVVT
ncbi:hypothetical protein M0R72_05980 [Candidatus Pacearchaeota archaeon]|jgi:hypothetical protein|nr:hypothetical protein [Candidatus Pacearchaeota archaeon]